MRRIKNGREYFVFPGGGVEKNESLKNALVREIKEEFNIDIKIEKLLFQIKNQGREEFYSLVKEFTGVPKIGGEEKERMNENNQYFPVWLDFRKALKLPNLYPGQAKTKVEEIIKKPFNKLRVKENKINQKLIQKLRDWRSKKGRQENVELYLILHNKTIEAIAEALPINKEEFITIKGLGQRKYEKYGQEIISIVNECLGVIPPEIEDKNQEKIYSVSDFLELINSDLGKFHVKVKGEISSVDMRDNYLFFTIKDLEQESVVSCFMWEKDYEISDIDIKE